MTTNGGFKFRLYITGDAENSSEAVANLAELCRVHMQDEPEIEFIDISVNPERGLADGIFMTPTLIKIAPLPSRMIVGTLSNVAPVLSALGLGRGPRTALTAERAAPDRGSTAGETFSKETSDVGSRGLAANLQ